MKPGLIVSLVAGGVVALTIVSSYISYANYGNRTEKALAAKLEDNQNIYANGTRRIIEVAQVPTMYRQDVERVFTAALQGRYGADGSQAMFQWLQEQNPQLDPSIYRRVQQVMEQFRNEFQLGQRELIDQRRSYETSLGNVWSGIWLRMAGYPSVDLKKFDIVTTDTAAETFRTKRDDGVNLMEGR